MQKKFATKTRCAVTSFLAFALLSLHNTHLSTTGTLHGYEAENLALEASENATQMAKRLAPRGVATKNTQPDIHVAFACDTDRSSQTRTMLAAIRSVVSHSKDAQRLNFHIFVRRGHEHSIDSLISCALPGTQLFKHFTYSVPDKVALPIKVRLERERRLRTPFNYVRFFLAEWLPQLEKVLYLDTDIIALDDVAAIFDRHLMQNNNYTIAAAARQLTLENSINFSNPEVVKAGIRPAGMAFNAGVLLIRLDNWRQQNMTQRVKSWMELNTKKPIYPLGSQPPLQLSVGDAFEEINSSWNVDGAGHSQISQERLQDAKLIHWTGPRKGCEDGAHHSNIYKRYDTGHCFESLREFCQPIETEYWNIFDQVVD